MKWKFYSSLLTLVLVNLIPLVSVYWLGWQLGDILFSYWLETVVVCIYGFLKILASQQITDEPELEVAASLSHPYIHFSLKDKYDYAREFLWRSILLLFVSRVLVWIVIPLTSFSAISIFLDLKPLANWSNWFSHWGVMLLALVLSHGYSFISNYLLKGEYHHVSPKALMNAPLDRIAVMYAAVILGGFLVIRFQTSMVYLMLLIFFKIVLDIIWHLRERAASATKETDLVTDIARQI